jgi:hypothetical protein
MPHVNHIYLKRKLASFPHKVLLRNSPCGVARRWADANTKGDYTWSGWHANVTFYFDSASDALMFKLTYG